MTALARIVIAWGATISLAILYIWQVVPLARVQPETLRAELAALLMSVVLVWWAFYGWLAGVSTRRER